MADNVTVARPYAQAVFELASAAQDYPSWSEALVFMTALVRDPAMQELIHNPRIEQSRLTDLLIDLCADRVPEQAINFIKLLVRNDRLTVVPNIAAQYEVLRAEAEKTVEAQVLTALPLDKSAQDTIAKALQKRLGRKVHLQVVEDKSLLGGAVVRAGDLVIDGSAQQRLKKLAGALVR